MERLRESEVSIAEEEEIEEEKWKKAASVRGPALEEEKLLLPYLIIAGIVRRDGRKKRAISVCDLGGIQSCCEAYSVLSPQEAETWESRKRKLTSPVWNHFVKRKVDGIEYAFCERCGAKYKAVSKNGTKSLLHHIEKCFGKPPEPSQSHPVVTGKDKEKQKDLLGYFSSDREFKKARNEEEDCIRGFQFNQEVSQQELAKAIVINQSEFDGFERFTASIQPRFKMPSREEVKRDIRSLYEVQKRNMHEVHEKVTSRIAITVDIWTSDQQKHYLLISAHFLDESWLLRKCDLRFIYIPVPHDTQTLWSHLTASLLEFNIGTKISTITMANCSRDGLDNLHLEKIEDGLLLGARLVHMQCGAHVINCLAQDWLSVVERVTEKIRETLGFWTASRSREMDFAEVAHELNIPHRNKKLRINDTTQWNSTYLMLEASIAYKEVFSRLKDIDSLHTILPSEEEWDLLRDICGKLKLLYDFAELFSGSEHVTSNNCFPKICLVREGIAKWVTCSNEVISRTAWKTFRKFKEYWEFVHEVFAIAVILDPRYKLNFVEYFFIIVYGSQSSREVDRVRKKIYELFHEYQLKSRANPEATSLPHCDGSGNSSGLGADPLVGYDRFIESGSYDNVRSSLELKQYLEAPLHTRTQDFDILRWWRKNGAKYPMLQLIARDFLSIPISCATSSPAFSALGRVLPEQHSKLNPDTLETLICTNNWLWNEMGGTCQGVLFRDGSVEDEDEDCSD